MRDARLVFAESLKKLMQEKSLDKITVTEIVEESGLTRQTFYRHFDDKYHVVNWYFEKLADKSFREIGTSKTLYEGLVKKFEFLLNDQVFFKEAFKSKDYNNVVDYDYRSILEFYTRSIESRFGKMTSDEEFILKFYCHASIEMTVEWASNGMKESPSEMARLLISAMPPSLNEKLSIWAK